MSDVIRVSKRHLLAFAAVILAFSFWAAFSLTAETGDASGHSGAEGPLKEKFYSLSTARTNLCAGAGFVDGKEDGDRLQGACCSAMDFHRYSEQVEGLKKYAHIDKIPSDPYDIPVSLARELLGYQKTITLTGEQQATYDEAVKMSHEGGPCCCKCWRWYAFEGLAKYLITEHGFDAGQVAEVWDMEDGCGGSGHALHGDESLRETFEPASS